MFRLDGRTAAITGPSRGLGAAIAVALAEAGADIVLLGPSADRMSQTRDKVLDLGRQCVVIELDVRDVASIPVAFEQAVLNAGRIDILVNNAGVNQTEPSVDVTPETWDRLHEINLRAPFFCAQAVAPEMIARGSGKIINVASDAGVKGFSEHAAYGSSKGGLLQLTRNLATEWGPSGVQVNAVAPGASWTDMTAPAMENPEIAASIIGRGVSGRISNPEEVGAAVVFLASKEADQVIGQTLFVDGGAHAL